MSWIFSNDLDCLALFRSLNPALLPSRFLFLDIALFRIGRYFASQSSNLKVKGDGSIYVFSVIVNLAVVLCRGVLSGIACRPSIFAQPID